MPRRVRRYTTRRRRRTTTRTPTLKVNDSPTELPDEILSSCSTCKTVGQSENRSSSPLTKKAEDDHLIEKLKTPNEPLKKMSRSKSECKSSDPINHSGSLENNLISFELQALFQRLSRLEYKLKGQKVDLLEHETTIHQQQTLIQELRERDTQHASLERIEYFKQQELLDQNQTLLEQLQNSQTRLQNIQQKNSESETELNNYFQTQKSQEKLFSDLEQEMKMVEQELKKREKDLVQWKSRVELQQRRLEARDKQLKVKRGALTQMKIELKKSKAENKEMKSELSQAQKEAQRLVDVNDEQLHRLDQVEHEIKELKDLKECAICMNQTRDTVVIPCGHVYGCQSCVALSQAYTDDQQGHFPCAICRSPVIFFCPIKFS